MKHTWKAALAVVALAASAGVAKADVTLSGPTGLFYNPTAEIVAKDAPQIAVDYQRSSGNGDHTKVYGVVGAFQAADRLEVNGGFHASSSDGYSPNTYNVGVKYRLNGLSTNGISAAVGADYGDQTDGGPSRYDAYLVGTKSFGNTSIGRGPIQGTLGVRYNHYRGSISDSKVDVFGGVAVPVLENGKLSVIGELGSKRSEYGDTQYSIGVRYHPVGSAFNLGAGYGRGQIADGKGLFLQAGYTFGK